MIRIANPLYDVIFRYLMADRESAQLFLSRLLSVEIVSLDFLATEQPVSLEDQHLTVVRLDFSAKIRTQDDSIIQVLLEVQKAKLVTDIIRFREYLGAQYASSQTRYFDAEGVERAIPIISVYILGYGLDHVDSPVVRVSRQVTDLTTNLELKVQEEFINSLTHECIIVQTSRLHRPYKSELERFLSIFDQNMVTPGDKHVLRVDDETYPEAYSRLLRRLTRAAVRDELRDKMSAEDYFIEELRARERMLGIASKTIRDQEKQLREQQEALRQQEASLRQQEDALRQQEDAWREQEAALYKQQEALFERDETVLKQQVALVERDEALHKQQEALSEKDRLLAEKDRLLAELLAKLGQG